MYRFNRLALPRPIFQLRVNRSPPTRFASTHHMCNTKPGIIQTLKRIPVLKLSIAGGTAGALTACALLYPAKLESAESPVHTGTFDGRGGWLENVKASTFTYTFLGGKFGIGDEKTSTYVLLPESETESYLKMNELSTRVTRSGNPMVRWEENVLPSNPKCEDRHVVDIVSRTHLPALLSPPTADESVWDRWAAMKLCRKDGVMEGDQGKDDVVMISVFDGHGGSYSMSELLRKTFHPCLAWAMANAPEPLGFEGTPEGVREPGVIQEAIHDAFVAWDTETLLAPLAVLSSKITLPDIPKFPGFPHPSLVELADVPSRGSAAVTAIVDVVGDVLYVANTGDTRAVAGWWDSKTDMWRCEVLTDDHDPEDPKEAARIRSLHPPEEHDDVVCDEGYWKRVLGAGQPSRAFGNSSFKHPAHLSDRLRDVMGANRVVPHRPILTPPYKTAEPDVVSRSIHPDSAEQLKFVILATDGLWDQISSEEAALLVSSHLAHTHHPDIPKALLPSLHPTHPPTEPRRFPAEDLPGTGERTEGSWVFEDDNAATHLIRNSLGRRPWDRETRQKVLSMRDGGVRVMRDDTTAVVVFFE